MKRWQRNLIRRVAGNLADFSEWCADASTRLYAEASRPKPKPLCFPTDLELMMGRVMEGMVSKLYDQITASILYGSAATKIRVVDDEVICEPVKFGLDIAKGPDFTTVTASRSRFNRIFPDAD